MQTLAEAEEDLFICSTVHPGPMSAVTSNPMAPRRPCISPTRWWHPLAVWLSPTRLTVLFFFSRLRASFSAMVFRVRSYPYANVSDM